VRTLTERTRTVEDCMVMCAMSTTADPDAGVTVTHPNRDKPVVQATRATVIVLLLASAALVLIVTIAGAKVQEGSGPVAIQGLFVVVYLVLAFYAGRWNRGVLPVAAALAVLLATFALVAGPSWFNRDQSGFTQPALGAGLLGLLTLLVIPVQILLIAFAMRGFSQGWNVELELRAAPRGPQDYGDASPHMA
jgi:FtsH-binding integral membrane protein